MHWLWFLFLSAVGAAATAVTFDELLDAEWQHFKVGSSLALSLHSNLFTYISIYCALNVFSFRAVILVFFQNVEQKYRGSRFVRDFRK